MSSAKKATVPPTAVAKPPTSTPATIVEPVYVPKPVELGHKSVTNKTMGMPKCKRPWKSGSKRSGIQKKKSIKTWEEKQEDRKKLKALKARIAETESNKKREVLCVLVYTIQKKSKAEAIKLKKKLKEINKMKSATY